MRSHKWRGKWSFRAGIELGETMEQALRRDPEETGLRFANIEFLCFQEFIPTAFLAAGTLSSSIMPAGPIRPKVVLNDRRRTVWVDLDRISECPSSTTPPSPSTNASEKS